MGDWLTFNQASLGHFCSVSAKVFHFLLKLFFYYSKKLDHNV